MKKYEILSMSDFNEFISKIHKYATQQEGNGKGFPKLNFIVKKYRKDKTPQQHKFFWVVVNQMVVAFDEVGYKFTSDDVAYFVKKQNGYVEDTILMNGDKISKVKSIADDSEDVNSRVMAGMIDYMISFCAINLNYEINDPR